MEGSEGGVRSTHGPPDGGRNPSPNGGVTIPKPGATGGGRFTTTKPGGVDPEPVFPPVPEPPPGGFVPDPGGLEVPGVVVTGGVEVPGVPGVEGSGDVGLSGGVVTGGVGVTGGVVTGGVVVAAVMVPVVCASTGPQQLSGSA